MKIMSYIERDTESGYYIATIPSIPGAHTQAQSLDELQKNLQEVLELCILEMSDEEKKCIPEFIGISQLEIDRD
jgi:predicted RNase H-like HicB family nuclease